MKRAPSPQINPQILEEASRWFVDFRLGDVDAAASEHFDEWLRRSPEHIRAYWEIAKTYVELEPASYSGKLNVDELIAYAKSDTTANVVALKPSLQPTDPREPDAVRSPLRYRIFAAVGCVVLLLMGAATWWQMQRYPIYEADIGERRSITLADGSAVDLNARSKLRIEYSTIERRVELLEGRALFLVAKDRNRPFLVHSGNTLVRAIGTQFDVNRKDSGTTVTVLEGRVAVVQAGTGVSSPPLADPSAASAVYVSAGEQVTVSVDARTTPAPRRANLSSATSWSQRELLFDGSKLRDVAAEFNRYNTSKLIIEDPALMDLEISGVYSSKDPTSLVRFLRDEGLAVTEDHDEIRITTR